MKSTFTITLLFLSIYLNAQTFNSKYFINTKWFSKNSDSSFYKADTISLIKYSNCPADGDCLEDAVQYLHGSDFLNLSFQKNNMLLYSTTRVERWQIEMRRGAYTWSYTKDGILHFYFKRKTIGSFKPVVERQIEIGSRYTSPKVLYTTEILLKRMADPNPS